MAYGGMGLMGYNMNPYSIAPQGQAPVNGLGPPPTDGIGPWPPPPAPPAPPAPGPGNVGLMPKPPEPPPGMMLNPAYEDWQKQYGRYFMPNLKGGRGQDMMNDMNWAMRLRSPSAPQQWIFNPDWEADEAGKKPPPPPPPPPPPGGGIDRPAKFAPPPGGYTNWKPPVAPPNVGGGGSGEVPPLFLPPPGQRDDLFHKAPNPAIAQVAQALLGRR